VSLRASEHPGVRCLALEQLLGAIGRVIEFKRGVYEQALNE
jgi:hypothetical protein